MTSTGHTRGDGGPAGPGGGTAPGSQPSLEELAGLFFQVVGDMRQHFTDRAAEFDLTFPQAMALRQLDDPQSMRELADRLCCDASNVTGIVDRLEARGLAERQPSPGDRRVKHIVLTDAGRALRRAHHDRLTAGVPLTRLSAEERGMLADLLQKMVVTAARAPLTRRRPSPVAGSGNGRVRGRGGGASAATRGDDPRPRRART